MFPFWIRGPMMKKPSDVNKIKEHKLTRRRIVRTLAAGGASVTTLENITVNDVKAADDDQVTIFLDTEGDRTKHVGADWYDQLTKANRVRQQIENGHLHKEGVIGVGRSPAEEPSVKVTLDRNNPEKEERRGEIPERKNGVKIEIKENSRGEQKNCADFASDVDDHPGGLHCQIDSEPGGSNSSQMVDTSGSSLVWGWGTAAHNVPNCMYSSPTAKAEHNGMEFGEIHLIDTKIDFAFIKMTEGSPTPYLADPDYPNQPTRGWGDIHQTLSKDGLAYMMDLHYDSDDPWAIASGNGDCEIYGWVSEDDVTYDQDYECQDYAYNQVEVFTDDDYAEEGDSGSMWICEDPDDSSRYLAIGSLCFSTSYDFLFGNFCWGPQGYTIDNKWGCFWTN